MPNPFIRYSLVCLGSLVVASYASANTHCRRGEITYFSCGIENSSKVASVCGSPKEKFEYPNNAADAWLQYRFGKIGAPEFVFPPKKKKSVEHFHGSWSIHAPLSPNDPGGFITELGFSNGPVNYSIMVAYVEDDHYGIYVTTKGVKERAYFPCAGVSVKGYSVEGDSNSHNFEGLVRNLNRVERER